MMINNTFVDPVIYVLPRKIYLCMIVHRVSRKLDILKKDSVAKAFGLHFGDTITAVLNKKMTPLEKYN